MTLKKVVSWALQIVALVLAVKFALWAYEGLKPDGPSQPQQEVLDIDKKCLMDADTGFCVCRHRWTNERLDVSRDECVSLTQDR